MGQTRRSLIRRDHVSKSERLVRHPPCWHEFGRTSGYTVGRITSINTDLTLSYDIGLLTFANQILIVGLGGTSSAEGGDSGALILERTSNRAVALLAGGSRSHIYGYANHIGDVLQALNVSLV
jgi:hypothetical protein